MSIAKYVAIAAVLVLSVISLACGSGSDSGETPTSSGVSAAQSNPAGAPKGKVSANNDTEEELEAAFEAAGIANAEEWAHEIEEYRPYPVDDTDFSVHAERLNTCRGELGMPG